MTDRVYGRRRAVALGAGLGALIVLAVVIALVTSGGGSSSPHYVPAGGRAVTAAAPAARLAAPRVSGFTPAPAAAKAANAQPLATRVAQLFLVSVNGATSAAASGSLAGAPWGGAVLTGRGVSGPVVAALRTALPAPSGSKALIAVDETGDEAALGSGGIPAAATRQALATGRALRKLGVAMTLAPEADVDIDGGVLTGRLYSSDPQTVARFTTAALTGYAQSGTIAAVGHFPGEGSASADPDAATAPATVGGSLASLRASDLVPFAAVAGQAPVIEMSNAVYAAFDGVTPASLLGSAVALLRSSLHFQGVVMSGDLDATLNGANATPGQAALAALRAGDDLLYITGPPSEHQAALNGVLTAARKSAAVRDLVRQALLRVLTLKARYGLLG